MDLDELEKRWNRGLAELVGRARLEKRVAEPALAAMIEVCGRARVMALPPVRARRLIAQGRSAVHSLVAEADHANEGEAAALEKAADALNGAVVQLAEVYERG